MKNKCRKAFLPIGCLLFAAVLGGCGPASSARPAETAQSAANKEVLQVESEMPAAKEVFKEALFAYKEILKAAPAIEGDHTELADASFSYEQNTELFGNHYELFALYDLNEDDVPELIALSTINFRWTPILVYTYADGEAVLLKDELNPAAHGTFEQMSTANGAYVTYICEKHHIHSVWRGTTPMGETAEENYAYALNGATLTAVDCTAGESEKTIFFNDIAKQNTPENVDAIIP